MRGSETHLAAAVVLVLAGAGLAGVAYDDPAGGWLYTYDGGAAASDSLAALDGEWRHDNGSDAWDGSAPGSPSPTAPGGVASDGDVLRIEDAVDTTADNGRFYFMRDVQVGTEVLSPTFLDDGVTLSFRARLPADPIDLAAGPDGYKIHNSGRGPFGIRQSTGTRLISFALITDEDTDTFDDDGLTFNRLNGTSPTSAVDTDDSSGTAQLLALDDVAQYHEFWITVQGDTSGGGTHRLEVYADGAMTPQLYHVTAGTGYDEPGGFPGDFADYLALGMPKSTQVGALDVDFFSYADGIFEPTTLAAVIPEPCTVALAALALAALSGYARRRRVLPAAGGR